MLEIKGLTGTQRGLTGIYALIADAKTDKDAQCELGMKYCKGDEDLGIEQNYERAFEYFLRAANQGHELAVDRLKDLSAKLKGAVHKEAQTYVFDTSLSERDEEQCLGRSRKALGLYEKINTALERLAELNARPAERAAKFKEHDLV